MEASSEPLSGRSYGQVLILLASSKYLRHTDEIRHELKETFPPAHSFFADILRITHLIFIARSATYLELLQSPPSPPSSYE